MPLRDMVHVHKPRMEIYRSAFSTEFRAFKADELRSIDRRYGHCIGATLGAIYDSDRNLIALSERDGGRIGELVVGVDAPWLTSGNLAKIARRLRGRSLYLGYHMNHYGHFLVETMTRFWAAEPVPFDHYVFFPFTFDDGEIATHDFHRFFLDRCGIPRDRVVILRDPAMFEEIHVPEQLCTINYRANVHMADLYDGIARAYRNDHRGKRIFLSRLRPYSRMQNPAEVEAIFRELDFEIAYPEALDIGAQLSLYANCSVMAGFAGTALHNCLFCPEGASLIELGDARSHDHAIHQQRICNQVAAMDAHFVPYAGTSDGRMDTTQLRRALAALPLLTTAKAPEADADFASFRHVDHYLWPARITAHLSNLGDAGRTGILEISGLDQRSSAIEGFSIDLDDDAPFGIAYRVQLGDGTWTPWSPSGAFVGARGLSQPIKGYAVRIEGGPDCRFRCRCLGRFTGQPDIVDAADGEDCATPAGGHLVGLQILLQRR